MSDLFGNHIVVFFDEVAHLFVVSTRHSVQVMVDSSSIWLCLKTIVSHIPRNPLVVLFLSPVVYSMCSMQNISTNQSRKRHFIKSKRQLCKPVKRNEVLFEIS